MYGDGRLCLPRQPRSEIDDWVAPYIEVPDSERTEIAERIDAIAILCGVTDPEVVYPSDAMSQALTGRFTAKAWTRFKAATDICSTLPNPKYHLGTKLASLLVCGPSCAERRRDSSGGEFCFNYEFHTLLVQNFCPWIVAGRPSKHLDANPTP